MGKTNFTIKLLLPLFCTAILFGCNSQEHTIKNEQQIVYSKQMSTEALTDGKSLTIHTVEFSSNNNVNNVAVALFDFETGEKIASTTVNDNGNAIFNMVEPNQPYEVVIYKIELTGEFSEQTRDTIVFDPANPILTIETFNASSTKSLAVPIVKQNPELPNGCEVTSLTAILNYYGIDVDKVTLAKDYLPTSPVTKKGNQLYGPDPYKAFAGDPAKKYAGYYVFADPIVDVANQVLFEHNSNYKALNLSDVSREEILSYVNSGVPVLTWTTIDWKEPRTSGYWIIEDTKEKHPIYMNLHAVVLTGYADGKVTIMNPLSGNETIDEKVFFSTFKSLGSHAIVIL
ncbi:MAG TPA: C39 family peptidase [Ureibacillus sp.]|nr:C39 family peptidase [Ureibacillus sp.]